MTKAFIDRIRSECTVDTEKYRYMIGKRSGVTEIRRIERKKLKEASAPIKFEDFDFVLTVSGWPSEEDTRDWDAIP